jgi:hypothetical protein
MKNALSLTISMLALGLSSAAPTFAADQADSITAAISGGDASLSLRYRFEYVDADDGSREAKASTLKTRITYKTLPYEGVSAVLEMDNNSVVFDKNYRSSKADTAEEAIVADPKYTEINQAYLDYAAPADTLIRYGRQRILLDNQRFVGGVGWRQNEQTYDAFSVINKSLPDTTILIANVNNVNNIFGKNSKDNDHQIYHINNKSIEGLNLSAYYYDLKDISSTYGLRASGKTTASDDLSILYTAEFAQQETDTGASSEVETDYMNLEAGVVVSGITAKLGYELMGSDNGNGGFSTPLGTNHKFGGWADKFLSTPDSGLTDASLTLSSKALGPKITLVYHQFDADAGSADLGSEIDLAVAQKLSDNYTGLIKLADYSAGDSGTDATKIWLQLVAKF